MRYDVKLNQGLARIKSSRQPGMLLIYKSWCPVCAELKNTLFSSREIDYLSNYLVIVFLKDDDEPQDKAYSPDGGYIPRILFLNPSGNIMYDVTNTKGDPRYKYFYTSDKDLIPNMRRVISSFQ